MSVLCCEECGILIDTDFFPEAFRKEFDNECLCTPCFNNREDGWVEQSLEYFNRYIAGDR